MDGRLVEDEDRRRLRDRERDEDELPLAQRQLAGVAAAQVADADPLDRARDGGAVGGADAAERGLVRQPAERDDLLDAHRERQRRELGDDRDRARDGPAVEPTERGAPPAAPARAPASSEPGQRPQQRRLAGAVRPDERDPLAGADDRSTSVERSAVGRTRR